MEAAARRWGNRVAYRIVDQYATRFGFKPKTVKKPLSIGELIALIDGATGHLGGDAKGLTSAYQNYNAPWGDPEGLVDLVIVTSDFYPELQAYYGEEAREWLASLERRASATGRRCWPIACPNWHRRVPKRYPRPPLPVPLAAAGCAASRLASVVARTRRSQGTLLAGLR